MKHRKKVLLQPIRRGEKVVRPTSDPSSTPQKQILKEGTPFEGPGQNRLNREKQKLQSEMNVTLEELRTYGRDVHPDAAKNNQGAALIDLLIETGVINKTALDIKVLERIHQSLKNAVAEEKRPKLLVPGAEGLTPV